MPRRARKPGWRGEPAPGTPTDRRSAARTGRTPESDDGSRARQTQGESTPAGPVVIAAPKGRLLEQLEPLLTRGGFDASVLTRRGRHLVRDDAARGLRWLLLKPDDVPTYVEYGAADLGVVGRDVLLEREHDVYAPLDLGIGRCRMVVAGLPRAPYRPGHPADRTLRVGTKFPTTASRHFMGKGHPVEVIYLTGSVELAPLAGLADVIVDLVESGETLRQNGLVEVETICDVSAVVVANRVGLKLKREAMVPILEALRRAARQDR